jgi:scyllo-inositol 2-dehydrogenase (NADP+)
MNKIYNVGLSAFGMSGWVFHAPFLNAHNGFNFYAAFERTKNEAQVKYPNVITYRSLDELLNDINIDIIVVNSPSITHFEYTKAALLAGKHVIVEKPFTATVAQANELIEIANEKQLMLSVFHNRRFDSDYLAVKKIVESNVLGNLVDVEIHYDRFTPALSYKTHKETPTDAVGNLYDLGSHLIDQALQLFGMPNGVYAHLAYIRNNTQVDDFFDVKLYYNNFQVTLKSSYFVKEIMPSFILHGTNGSFIKPRADTQEASLINNTSPLFETYGLELVANTGLLHTDIDGIVLKQHIPNEKGNYMLFYNGVYNHLTTNENLPVKANEAMQVIQIIEAAKQSVVEKRLISLI